MAAQEEIDVVVFWDYENVRIASKTHPDEICNVQNKLRGAVNTACSDMGFRAQISEKRLYFDSEKERTKKGSAVPRVPLDCSGVTLVDCPTRNKKEGVDKKILIDVMNFVGDKKKCIVLISSDGDFAPLLARLADKQVKSILIHGPNVAATLKCSATRSLPWSNILHWEEAALTESSDKDSTLKGNDDQFIWEDDAPEYNDASIYEYAYDPARSEYDGYESFTDKCCSPEGYDWFVNR